MSASNTPHFSHNMMLEFEKQKHHIGLSSTRTASRSIMTLAFQQRPFANSSSQNCNIAKLNNRIEMRVVNLSCSTTGRPVEAQQQSNKPPTSASSIPRGLRGLPPTATPIPSSELGRLREDAASLKSWWKDPRWKQTKRIYSGR
jgi:hypothetical protein